MAATRIFNGALTANQVAVIEADAVYRQARIVNVDGAERIYVRTDGIDPEAPWDDCEVMPAAIGYLIIRLPNDPDRDGNSEVRLRSPGTPSYSVKFG